MALAITHTSERSDHWQPAETKIIDGRPVRFRDVVVCEFRIADVEDPDIMAGEPMWRWQQSQAGQFIAESAMEPPYWTRHVDHATYGYQYRIMARLSEQNECFWRLKWGGLNKQ